MNKARTILGKRNPFWAWLGLSLILFAALMAFRAELHSIWLRALVAGIAFGLLYPAIQASAVKHD
jgi:hypothetical protein